MTKRFFPCLLLIFMAAASSRLNAQNPAFVYFDEASLQAGKPVMGVVTDRGIVANAPQGASLPLSFFVGVAQEPLKTGSLLQYDAASGMMLIKPLEPVDNAQWQALFQGQWERLSGFLSIEAPSSIAEALPSVAQPHPFKVLINNQDVTAGPVALQKKRNQIFSELTLVRISTEPVWNFSLTLEAEPKMSFWLKKRAKELSDVPRPTFRHDYQAFFKPLRAGAKPVVIPLELYFIKDDSYLWTLSVKTKKDEFEIKIPVVFKNPT